jgi:Flp pilus assembly protein TadD
MRNRGDKDGAIGVYREMLRQAPDDHSTLVALAEAQINDEDVEGAIETLERIEAGLSEGPRIGEAARLPALRGSTASPTR